MSLGGLVFGIAIISFVGLMAVKCIPAFTEYMTVKRIVNQLEQSSETEVKVLKDNFSKRASIEYVTSVTVQDLTFARNGSSWTISFDYEKRIPIAGNASLVFQFTN